MLILWAGPKICSWCHEFFMTDEGGVNAAHGATASVLVSLPVALVLFLDNVSTWIVDTADVLDRFVHLLTDKLKLWLNVCSLYIYLFMMCRHLLSLDYLLVKLCVWEWSTWNQFGLDCLSLAHGYSGCVLMESALWTFQKITCCRE